MPLPLPKLDDRRWSGLVEEGRALIPRYAPGWTDQNVHDPGITLIELFAWLAEMTAYRLNQVPSRHKRKFLSLIGFSPRDPAPAHAALSFRPAPGSLPFVLPAGAEFEGTDPDGQVIPFRTLRNLTISPLDLAAVLVDAGGGSITDFTRDFRDGLDFAAFGPNPQPGAALYLGFAQLASGVPVSIGLRLRGPGNDRPERARIIAESVAQQEACRPIKPRFICGQQATEIPATLPPYHSARIAWEVFANGAWTRLTAAQVSDDTRALTLDGFVEVTIPAGLAQTTVGGVSLFYMRAVLIEGTWDAAPILLDIVPNAVEAEQAVPVTQRFVFRSGVTPSGPAPVPGSSSRLVMQVDERSVIQSLSFGGASGPEFRVWSLTAGEITLEAELAGRGTGMPDQQVTLRQAPVEAPTLHLYTLTGTVWQEWKLRVDFDASTRTSFDFTLEPTSGLVTFGSGERGRVPEAGSLIFAVYRATRAELGDVGPGTIVRRRQSPPNAVLMAGLPSMTITNRGGAADGAAAKPLMSAMGRAVETLHAHERLLDLAAEAKSTTLDQIDGARVRALAAPTRGVNLLDLERLALAVPGTQVARARAWADLHPSYPCLEAPGVVALVIVPELPPEAPSPTPGLLNAVRRYLHRRRMITTVLHVVGPQYLEVKVTAKVQSRTGAGASNVRARILQALQSFLNPLTGRPDGLGWPFGRDVFRTEILQLIENVPGVDHVLSLALSGGGGENQCGDLTVCPMSLVRSGAHQIEVL